MVCQIIRLSMWTVEVDKTQKLPIVSTINATRFGFASFVIITFSADRKKNSVTCKKI